MREPWHGCDLRADAFQPQQRRQLGAALLARLRRARVAHGLDLGQVPQHELEAVELPADLRREPARQRAAVPGHEPGQTFAAIRPERLVVVDPLRRAQALDPVAEPQALLEQRPSLAAEAALVLVLRRGRSTMEQTCRSPRDQAIKARSSACASSRSVFARRARRSTCSEVGSMTWLAIPSASSTRCSQNPSRPAS